MDNGDKSSNLVGPTGKPLRSRGIVVLKIPRTASPITKQGIEAIIAVTRCNLIILPMEYELLLGEIAGKELEAIHRAIHSIIEFEKEKK